MVEQLKVRWPHAAIPCFLALTILFGVPLEALMIHAGRVNMADYLVIYADMWTPAAAAIITCLLLKKKLSVLRLVGTGPRYAWLGYGLPIIAACITYPALWITDLAPLQFTTFEGHARSDLALGCGASFVMFWLVATNGVIRSCASALGEEIGWRGLLVPALSERMRFSGVVAVSGLIWGAWHLPLMLSLPGPPSPVSLLMFFVSVTAAGGIAAWLRLRSDSLWPAVLFHASHNAILQLFFDPLTLTTGNAGYFATEGGLGMVVAYVLVLALLLKLGGVPLGEEDEQSATVTGVQGIVGRARIITSADPKPSGSD